MAAILGPAGRRFRQAIGVAIRIKMKVLGWSTTGLKGPVGRHFSRAEKYRRNDVDHLVS